jgi:hypothetical protein
MLTGRIFPGRLSLNYCPGQPPQHVAGDNDDEQCQRRSRVWAWWLDFSPTPCQSLMSRGSLPHKTSANSCRRIGGGETLLRDVAQDKSWSYDG